MPVRKGEEKIINVYSGLTSIAKIYKGTELVFQKWDESLGGLGVNLIGGETLGGKHGRD